MCNCNCKCNKSKVIPRQAYTETLNEFIGKKGLLYPIYANTIINDIAAASVEMDASQFINKIINIFEGHDSCSNRVVGYFASLPDSSAKNGYMISMSFCSPEDYHVFSQRYARFFAMRKALSGNGLLAHCEKKQQVIFTECLPLYYFGYGNTIMDQFKRFTIKCDKYYNK